MSTLRVLPITSESQTLTSRGRALRVTALAALLLAACGPLGAPGATATPGRYSYLCDLHDNMTAVIVVTAP